MRYEAIDSVFLAAGDLDDACQPYERLGLRLSPAAAGRRCLFVGNTANLFTVEFIGNTAPDSPLAVPMRQARDASRSLFAVALHLADLDQAVAAVKRLGLPVTQFGNHEANLAWLPLHEQAGTDLVLMQHTHPVGERHAAAEQGGLFAHALRLKRLDHLATVTHDLEARTRFWTEVLGVGVAAEVTTQTMVIRQLRFGDAVLELLGPVGKDSPLWKRPPGLVSMASWEIGDLETAVAHVRAAGFTVSEPAAGPLPGTRIATVPGTELAGVNLQLLQYV
jgi:catechol 2,3-dioxygenase-like lactoylglutathione lyase family enzyme